jgi:DNA mismatch repair ATPase MutL
LSNGKITSPPKVISSASSNREVHGRSRDPRDNQFRWAPRDVYFHLCVYTKNLLISDPKKFFEKIYLAKSKLIEGSIPNVSKSGYAKHAVQNFENMSFTKSLFKNLEMIGQVDCKFIAVLEKTKKLILLFDQHAVHERVRLEQLCESRHALCL